MKFDQGNQTLLGHHLIYLDQEAFVVGLLALLGVHGIGEGHLLHRKPRRLEFGDFAKSGSVFSELS